MTGANERPKSDLLYGLEAIGEHLSLGSRQVQYLHDKGELPTFKMGRSVCARRSTLARHFAEQEAGYRRTASNA